MKKYRQLFDFFDEEKHITMCYIIQYMLQYITHYEINKAMLIANKSMFINSENYKTTL